MQPNNLFECKQTKPTLLEQFGLYYLRFFKKIDTNHTVFNYTDEHINKKVKRITFQAIILACVVGAVCVFPTVWVDVYFGTNTALIHYSWVIGVTILSVVVELYLLFIIALRAVYKVSELINLNTAENDLLNDGLFSVKNILARAALELPDPEMKLMGIDPFKKISKKNILVLSLIYKAKIFVTNIIVKYGLIFFVGKTIFGVSILYEAILVECFWNSVVIIKVVKDARLRLFGFALANQIGRHCLQDGMLQKLSTLAKKNCLRAIGNAVVMTQNYHPNMVILFIRFQQIFNITEIDEYDNWQKFIDELKKVSTEEKYFLLDLFTVAAAFDSKLSPLENSHLAEAYGEHFAIYKNRLNILTQHLQKGKLNAALQECKLDFVAG